MRVGDAPRGMTLTLTLSLTLSLSLALTLVLALRSPVSRSPHTTLKTPGGRISPG